MFSFAPGGPAAATTSNNSRAVYDEAAIRKAQERYRLCFQSLATAALTIGGNRSISECTTDTTTTQTTNNTTDTTTTITITATDAATLLANGSGITRQPPGPEILLTKDFIVYTNPNTQTLTTTIAGTEVTIHATPTNYTWDWGDGTTTTTTDPGAPWPNQTITHHYTHTATNITTTLTTTWQATYTPNGGTTQPITGTITTTNTTTPYNILRTTTYLTDQAETTQQH
ncbi:hypothetical protein [Actinomyces ruminis]|uniref:PKD domain-containing protein n=1 Tax=Actinomyces ruminis TaxID=1937003 RepID=A0ABX4MFG1_9ACTO|nr:hypothetical protein [Actinomyces ruminis]PHP52882.1 hypothetical protein BW737_006340 [Actinomyces ruminis]